MQLRAEDGHELHSVLAQPKRQALLLYLAVARPQGFHRRDTLLGILWPEMDDARGRAALSRAVHYLRQALGGAVVLSRGHDEIGLDWTRFRCDVAGFENALDAGQLAEGLALYRGDLLPGFYVDDAPQFEEWLSAQRTRLRTRALEACRVLGERTQETGSLDDAVEWARRAVSLAPYDEPAMRRLMAMQDAAGDRSGALRTYEELHQRLRAELDVEPAPETTALAGAIRERVSGAPILQPARQAPNTARGDAGVAAMPVQRQRSIRRATPRRLAAAGAVLVLMFAGVLGWNSRGTGDGADAAPATLAVAPFVVEGDSSAGYLSAGMVSLLSEQLNRGSELRALDARTVLEATQQLKPESDAATVRRQLERLRPRFVVTGLVSARHDSLVITVSLFDSVQAQRPTARAFASGAAVDVTRLVSELAAQLLLTQPSRGVRLEPGTPHGVLTSSLPALKHYLDGEQAYAGGHFREAVEHYRASVAEDSAFALAYLWLSRAANWTGDQATMAWANSQALHRIERLSPLNQFRVRAWSAHQAGRVREAERLSQLILANEESAIDAWQVLGELRYHWGPLLGWTRTQARDAFQHALALSRNDAGSAVHLARIAAADDRLAQLDSMVAAASAAGIDDVQRLELRALRAFLTDDRRAQQEVIDAGAKLDDDAAYSMVVSVAAGAGHHPRTRELTRVLASPGRSPQHRTAGALLDALLAMTHGQWRTADSVLAAAPALSAARRAEYRAALAALPFHPVPAAALRQRRSELERWPDRQVIGPGFGQYAANEIYGPRRTYLLGMLHLKLGDTAAVERTITKLQTNVDNEVDRAYRQRGANLLRAELLRARGRPQEALQLLGAADVLPDAVLPGLLAYQSAHDRFLRAELARTLGDLRDALRWYDTFPDPAGYDLMYLAPVNEGRARALQQLGEHARAADEQRRGRALRMQPDADPAVLY